MISNFKKLPLGIKIIGMLLLAYGILAILGIVYSINTLRFIISGLLSGQIHILGPKSFVELAVHNILKPVGFVLVIIANVGFLRLKNWARILVLYVLLFEILGIFGLMYSKSLMGAENIAYFILVVCIPLCLAVFYLTRTRIKKLYEL